MQNLVIDLGWQWLDTFSKRGGGGGGGKYEDKIQHKTRIQRD